MKKLIVGCLLGIFSWQAYAISPIGNWQVIDEVTGKPKAIVKIWETDSHGLNGRVIKALSPTAPRVGMMLLEDLKPVVDHPNLWAGGTMVDARYGKRYKCVLQLKDNGHTLSVRSFLGLAMLGSQQTWQR